MTKSRGINAPRVRWTEADLSYLREKYPDATAATIAVHLSRPIAHVYAKANRLGLRKSEAFLASEAAGRLRAGDGRGTTTRFQPGQTPWSKGKKVGTRGRAGETQFKKGTRPHNAVPVGTVLPNTDGYYRRKVAEPNEWVFIHREVWESVHGPIPSGYRIWWRDGNKANNAIENLELLSGADHMARTTIQRYPPELKQAMRALGKLKRTIEARHEKQD